MAQTACLWYQFSSQFELSCSRLILECIHIWYLYDEVFIWFCLRFHYVHAFFIYNVDWNRNCKGGWLDANGRYIIHNIETSGSWQININVFFYLLDIFGVKASWAVVKNWKQEAQKYRKRHNQDRREKALGVSPLKTCY